MTVVPPPGSSRPTAGVGPDGGRVEYHQLLRLGRPGWWWPLVGVVSVALLYVVAQVVLTIPLAAALALAGNSAQQVSDKLQGTGEVTPSFLLYIDLGWALAIPAVWLVVRLVHGLSLWWVESVVRRLRWRWLAVCLGTALVALVATVVVSSLLPAQGPDTGGSGGLNPWTATLRDFLLVVLITTPLQAAGEEHVFRGYLMQAVGALVPARTASRVLAVVVSALVFAIAHGAGQGPAVFFDRFGFGVGAAVLAIVTGGLEAGIAMHVLNNFVAFGSALFFGSMTTALHASGGNWWQVLVTLTQLGVWLGITIPLARRLRLDTSAPATVLASPATRV